MLCFDAVSFFHKFFFDIVLSSSIIVTLFVVFSSETLSACLIIVLTLFLTHLNVQHLIQCNVTLHWLLIIIYCNMYRMYML